MPLKFARYKEVSLYRGFFSNRKSSIKPPPGGLIYFKLIWVEGEGLNIFDFETTMVSLLQKELEYKVEKLKYMKF